VDFNRFHRFIAAIAIVTFTTTSTTGYGAQLSLLPTSSPNEHSEVRLPAAIYHMKEYLAAARAELRTSSANSLLESVQQEILRLSIPFNTKWQGEASRGPSGEIRVVIGSLKREEVSRAEAIVRTRTSNWLRNHTTYRISPRTFIEPMDDTTPDGNQRFILILEPIDSDAKAHTELREQAAWPSIAVNFSQFEGIENLQVLIIGDRFWEGESTASFKDGKVIHVYRVPNFEVARIWLLEDANPKPELVVVSNQADLNPSDERPMKAFYELMQGSPYAQLIANDTETIQNEDQIQEDKFASTEAPELATIMMRLADSIDREDLRLAIGLIETLRTFSSTDFPSAARAFNYYLGGGSVKTTQLVPDGQRSKIDRTTIRVDGFRIKISDGLFGSKPQYIVAERDPKTQQIHFRMEPTRQKGQKTLSDDQIIRIIFDSLRVVARKMELPPFETAKTNTPFHQMRDDFAKQYGLTVPESDTAQRPRTELRAFETEDDILTVLENTDAAQWEALANALVEPARQFNRGSDLDGLPILESLVNLFRQSQVDQDHLIKLPFGKNVDTQTQVLELFWGVQFNKWRAQSLRHDENLEHLAGLWGALPDRLKQVFVDYIEKRSQATVPGSYAAWQKALTEFFALDDEGKSALIRSELRNDNSSFWRAVEGRITQAELDANRPPRETVQLDDHTTLSVPVDQDGRGEISLGDKTLVVGRDRSIPSEVAQALNDAHRSRPRQQRAELRDDRIIREQSEIESAIAAISEVMQGYFHGQEDMIPYVLHQVLLVLVSEMTLGGEKVRGVVRWSVNRTGTDPYVELAVELRVEGGVAATIPLYLTPTPTGHTAAISLGLPEGVSLVRKDTGSIQDKRYTEALWQHLIQPGRFGENERILSQPPNFTDPWRLVGKNSPTMGAIVFRNDRVRAELRHDFEPLDFDLDQPIDLSAQLHRVVFLQNLGMYFLAKFKSVLTQNATTTADKTFAYLKNLDETMRQTAQRGMNVVDFGEFSDWARRIQAMSFYLYGEVLTEEELITRLDRRNPKDLYFLDNAGSVFAAMIELVFTAIEKEKSFTFREFLKAYRSNIQEFRRMLANVQQMNLTTGEFESAGDHSHELIINPDEDIDMLKRALNIAFGHMPERTELRSDSHESRGPKRIHEARLIDNAPTVEEFNDDPSGRRPAPLVAAIVGRNGLRQIDENGGQTVVAFERSHPELRIALTPDQLIALDDLKASQAIPEEELQPIQNTIKAIRDVFESSKRTEADQTIARQRFNSFLTHGRVLGINAKGDVYESSQNVQNLAAGVQTREALIFLPEFNDQLGAAFRQILEAVSGRQEVVIYYDSPVMKSAILDLIDGVSGAEQVQFVQSDDQTTDVLTTLDVTRAHLIGYGDEDRRLGENLAISLIRQNIEAIRNQVANLNEFFNFLGQAVAHMTSEWQANLLRAKSA